MGDSLATRRLGGSDVELTILGMGGAPLGDLFEKLDNIDSLQTIQRAYDLGIRYFDTAPLYGRGLSEIRLGLGLHAYPRRDYVVSTKVGRYADPDLTPEQTDKGFWAGGLDFRLTDDYSADAAERSLTESLLRLGKSRIDIVLIHDVDVWTHGTAEAFERRYAEAMAGAYPGLARLREQGMIGAIGVGINEADVAARFVRDGDFDCVMLAGRYTLLEQGALDDYLPEAERRSVGTLLAGPFNSGVLAAKSGDEGTYNYAKTPADVRERVSRLRDVCRAHDTSLHEAAIQFPLGHPSVASVVPGMVRPEEVTSNVEAIGKSIPNSLWTDLKTEGLLRDDAPTPA